MAKVIAMKMAEMAPSSAKIKRISNLIINEKWRRLAISKKARMVACERKKGRKKAALKAKSLGEKSKRRIGGAGVSLSRRIG
jgi:hypothetical protein